MADYKQAASCVIGSAATSADQKLVADCLSKNSPWSDAVICFANGKKQIPAPVQQALDCAPAQSSLGGFGTCLASKNIPQISGDLGKLATCAAGNDGAGLGTAACMLGAGLNADQKIAVQCATHSVDLTSWAVCTGGLLTFKEFNQCKNAKFGDDRCFGENNEIRKFLRNVLGQDIHKDTLVGQIINVPIEIVKGVLNFSPPPIQVGTINGNRVCLPWC